MKKTNATFSYGDNSFDVYLTRFSYSWKVMKKGSSQSRQAQTVYPFRMVQSDLNVELQFPGVGDRDANGVGWKTYRAFCDFVRSYHLRCTSDSGILGKTVPFMRFRSSAIPARTNDENGLAYAGGIDYAVTMPSINVVFSNDAVVQTVSLTLGILTDWAGFMDGTSTSQSVDVWTTNSPSFQQGTWDEVMSRVSKKDVSAKGDSAFWSSTAATATKAISTGAAAVDGLSMEKTVVAEATGGRFKTGFGGFGNSSITSGGSGGGGGKF